MATFEEMLGMGDDTSDDDVPDELPGIDVPAQAPANKGRAQQALDFYMSKGLSLPAASGIVGNLMQESGSGLNPNLIHDGGIGVGIAGWNGTRRTALRNLAAARGTNEKDFDTQLEHSWRELNSSERSTMSMLRGAQTPEQAARIALGYFRPSDPQTQNRIRNAIAIAGGSNPSSPALQSMRASYVAPTTDEENEQPAVLPPRKMITQDPARSAEIQQRNEEIVPPEQVNPIPFLQQLLSKGGSSVANMPFSVMNMTQLLPSIAGSKTAQDIIEANNAASATNKSTFDAVTGAEANPTTIPGQIGESLGENLTPMGKKYTVPMTAAGAGLSWLGKLMSSSDAMAAPAYDDQGLPVQSMTKKEQKEIDDAKGVANAQKFFYDGMPYDPNLTQFDPREQRVVSTIRNNIKWKGQDDGITTVQGADGKFYNVPGNGSPMNNDDIGKKWGWQNIPSYATADQAKEAWIRMNVATQQEMAKYKTIVQSDGGPNSVDIRTLLTYGGVAAATTAGMIFGPKVFQYFKAGSVPPLWRTGARDVALAHPDVGAVSLPGDLFKTGAYDKNLGLVDLAERSGLGMKTAEEIEKVFNIQSGANAVSLAQAAINEGKMQSLNYTFNVPVSVKRLTELYSNPQAAQYLHALNLAEEFNYRETLNYMNPKVNPAPSTIRGKTQQEAIDIVNAMEKINPDLKEVATHYQNNVRELRRFLTDGEWGTMTKNEAALLNKTRPTFIPMDAKQTGAAVPIGNPIADLGKYMQDQMVARFKNEANGTYIDAVKDLVPDARHPNKRITVRVSDDAPATLTGHNGGPALEKDPLGPTRNPEWKNSFVDVLRKGEREVHSTDPFIASVLNMDPFYTSGHMALFGLPKRIFEATTTGDWAPWFAVTNAIRGQTLGAMSPEVGLKAPWFPETIMGIPQQLAPPLMRSIANGLDGGSLKWMSSIFGQDKVDGAAAYLMQKYAKSWYATMQSAGTSYGWRRAQLEKGNADLTQAMANVDPSTADFLKSMFRTIDRGYKTVLQSTHNAPNFAYTFKNRNSGLSPAELAREGRRLTGDNTISGQYVNSEGRGVNFSTEGMNPADKFLVGVTHMANTGISAARETVPWINPVTQGMRRLVEAYFDEPAKFMGRAWLYGIMPSAASYLWSRASGLDPNGRSYADYQVNGRSTYRHAMNHYFAIPGRPAEDGVELPRVQELSFAAVMMEHLLDHSFRGNLFPITEDLKDAAFNFASVLAPPFPAVANPLFGLQGMIPPQGFFGGEPYTPRDTDYNQFRSGMPLSVETLIRAMAPGTGDIALRSMIAASHSPTAWDGIVAGAKTAGKAMATKTPIVRDILGLPQPMSGNIPMAEKYYESKREIDKLLNYFKDNDLTISDSKGNITREAGATSLKGRSKPGDAINDIFLPHDTIKSNIGPEMPEPTNPLYTKFIEELYKDFGKDSVSVGGLGIQTAATNLKRANRYVRQLRRADEGNMQAWIDANPSRDDYMAEMKKFGINPNDLKAVRTYFVTKQQDAIKHVLFMIKTVENKLSGDLGRPIKIKDIEPYAKDQGGAESQDDDYEGE